MGRFHLCKWGWNCKDLQDKIIIDSNVTANTILNICKVLGLKGDPMCHEFIFNTEKNINTANSTRRNVLKIAAMFYDPTGLVCSIVFQLK